jgi:hypothetical protein
MKSRETIDTGALLRSAAADGARTHSVTIRLSGARVTRMRLKVATWLFLVASWCAYGFIDVTEVDGTQS